jgi:hypothetical protein
MCGGFTGQRTFTHEACLSTKWSLDRLYSDENANRSCFASTNQASNSLVSLPDDM